MKIKLPQIGDCFWETFNDRDIIWPDFFEDALYWGFEMWNNDSDCGDW